MITKQPTWTTLGEYKVVISKTNNKYHVEVQGLDGKENNSRGEGLLEFSDVIDVVKNLIYSDFADRDNEQDEREEAKWLLENPEYKED
jgi:hypothetical protein